MRITLLGDFINAGKVSVDVNIHSVQEILPQVTAAGTILDKKTKTIPVSIPTGVQNAAFLLSWEDDWGHYPTSDINMTIIDPNGNVFLNGNRSQAAPERATVENPIPGTWQVVVDGSNIPAGSDKFQLRVTVDGHILSH
jgi:hypothetical protein